MLIIIIIPFFNSCSNSAPIAANSSSGIGGEETPENSAQQKELQSENHIVEFEDIESILSHLHGT